MKIKIALKDGSLVFAECKTIEQLDDRIIKLDDVEIRFMFNNPVVSIGDNDKGIFWKTGQDSFGKREYKKPIKTKG